MAARNLPAGFDDTTSSTVVSDDASIWKFAPKHSKSTKNNPLCGVTLKGWFGLIWSRGRQIEWARYWPRLLLITFMAFFNSLLGVVETLLFEREIQQTELHESPVFILGHPRTGTTLLHGLLALDEENFATCSTFCSGFPSSFLWFEGIGKKLLSGVIDETRPMDNVKLTFDLPQEDELATNLLALDDQGSLFDDDHNRNNGGCSPYMPLFFMKQEPEFRPFYSFNKAEESPAVALGLKRWTKAFLYLLKKLTLRAQRRRKGGRQKTPPPRPQPRQAKANASSSSPPPPPLPPPQTHRLLLKSPVHTARVKLLLQLFPKAQFIYIHRHPYEVFASAAHMADTTYWYTYLNTPSDAQVTEFILKQYEVLWGEYESARGLVPPQQLIEVSFNDLSQNSTSVVRDIYRRFGWPGWSDSGQQQQNSSNVSTSSSSSNSNSNSSNSNSNSSNSNSTSPSQSMEFKVGREATQGIGAASSQQRGGASTTGAKEEDEKEKSYARNVHRPLPAGIRAVLDARWGDSFHRLGYAKGHVLHKDAKTGVTTFTGSTTTEGKAK